jgi:hypothetical protein
MTSLLNKVINALEQIILEVIDPTTGTVRWVEGEGDWAKDLFPQAGNQQVFTINEETPFLFDFLYDAKLLCK